MKTKSTTIQAKKRIILFALSVIITEVICAQNAVISTPLGIGKDCNTTKDTFRVLRYNPTSNTLSSIFSCKPNLASGGTPSAPGFSSSAGSIAFNPSNENVYYIATTTGNNSFVYNWRPDTCHTTTPKQPYSYYFATQFIVGLDFNPAVANEGYQLEFTGSTPPYNSFLRKVNFSSSYFGPSEPITFTAGKKIYVQNGDIIFTPGADLYVAFNNKMFKIDYSTYGTGAVTGTYIDTLNFGAGGYNLTGIAYVAKGTFIGSLQNSSSSACKFVEIDISSGSAVITPVTLPSNNFTATDMGTMISGIGVAKKVAAVVNTGGSNYKITYDLKVKNQGNTFLKNVQVLDSVKKVFGASFVSASVAALGTLPPGLTINSSYNGNTDCKLFVGGVSSILRAGPADSATVRITVNLSNPDINYTYYNTALGSATCKNFSTINILDSSNNSAGLRTDLNNNGIPDDANEDIPTPVKINGWTILAQSVLNLNASVKKDAVNLTWELINTEGDLTMYVQRSKDGYSFVNIGKIESNNQISSYNWTDIPDGGGSYFYRISFLNKEQKTQFSDVVKISIEPRTFTNFNVTPNPFNSLLKFSFFISYNDFVNYSLFDNNMKLIKSEKRYCQQGENTLTIDNLSNLSPGVYILQIKTNGNTYSKKLIKT